MLLGGQGGERSRMMLTHVTIVVKDQNAALEFYTKKMGFEKKADYTNPGQPRWLTVGPKGQAIEMVLWQAGMGSDPNLPASHRQPCIGTRWVLEVDDVRKTFAELKARGVKFKDAQPREEGWGFSADLTDPDGNHFRFMRRASPPLVRNGLRPARRHREPTTQRVKPEWLGGSGAVYPSSSSLGWTTLLSLFSEAP